MYNNKFSQFALAATLSDTRIETSLLSPFSDAGGVETRRRRWLCFTYLLSSFMASFSSLLVAFPPFCYHLNLPKSFRFVHSSLLTPAPSSSLLNPSVVMHRREASGSEFFSGLSRRSLTTIAILRLLTCLEIAVGDFEAGLGGKDSPIIFPLEISGRGHFSRWVSTVSIWVWFGLLRWSALGWSVFQDSWSDLVSSHSSLYILFSEPSLLFHQYSWLIGRGHKISFASTSLSWLWSYSYLTLGLCMSMCFCLEIRRAWRLAVTWPISNWFWCSDSHQSDLSSTMAPVIYSLLLINPRPDWSVSAVALSMRVWSHFGMYLNPYATKYLFKVRYCATDLIGLSLLYYSFEKRLQLSSHWERSLSQSSFVKERTVPSSWLSSRDRVVSFVLARIHSTFGTAVATLIDALGLVYVTVLSGKRCFLTSMSFSMTRQYLWGFITTTLPTHLDFISDSLSFSSEILSFSLLLVFVMYVSKFRGWLIPSFICKTQG